MGLFDKWRKKKTPPTKQPTEKKSDNPAEDPNMIRVFDKYGQKERVSGRKSVP